MNKTGFEQVAMFFPFFMPICRVWGNQNVWYLSGWIALVLCNSIHTFQCSNHLFALWYLEVGLLSLWRLCFSGDIEVLPWPSPSRTDEWIRKPLASTPPSYVVMSFFYSFCYEITIKMKRKKLSVCRSSLSVGLQSGWVRYALWIYFFILNIRSEKPNNEPKLVIMNLGQPW